MRGDLVVKLYDERGEREDVWKTQAAQLKVVIATA